MATRKQRRAHIAKLKAARKRLPPEARRVADQLISQGGKSTEEGYNGIKISMRNDKKVVRLVMYLAGKPQTWVEYNTVQMDGLLNYLQTVRKEMIAEEANNVVHIPHAQGEAAATGDA
jgi:hypothetical protein